MTAGLVLHPPPALIEGGVGKLDDVERVSDLNRQRQHRVEHRPIAGGEIERGPLDPITPFGGSRSEPSTRLWRSPAGDHIEKLAPAHVDDLRRPRLRPEPAKTSEKCLVKTARSHVADVVGVVDELLADLDDGAHHGVPAAAEFTRNIGHRSPVATNMQRRPPRSTCSERALGRGDLGIVVAPASTTGRAAPTLLAPHQSGRPTEHRQVNELNLADPVSMHHPSTPAPRSIAGHLDHHPPATIPASRRPRSRSRRASRPAARTYA